MIAENEKIFQMAENRRIIYYLEVKRSAKTRVFHSAPDRGLARIFINPAVCQSTAAKMSGLPKPENNGEFDLKSIPECAIIKVQKDEKQEFAK